MALDKITYNNKVSLNPQPSIANENKCTDSDLNQIKSVVNNAIDNLETIQTYSTTESVIGIWTNGKPLYRKVITGTFAYATQTITDIITGYDKVINYGGTITTPSGYITQIPEYTNSSNYCYFVLNTANDNATLTIPSSFVGGTFILIIEYTKTTD